MCNYNKNVLAAVREKKKTIRLLYQQWTPQCGRYLIVNKKSKKEAGLVLYITSGQCKKEKKTCAVQVF